MNPLPSELAGMRIICPFSNGSINGSIPKGDNRRLISFVVEILTTASLVFSTTSTVTVRRRLIGGATAGLTSLPQAFRNEPPQQIMSSDRTNLRIIDSPGMQCVARVHRVIVQSSIAPYRCNRRQRGRKAPSAAKGQGAKRHVIHS